MAHFPKPFFRKNRQFWYVQLRGKQINLGTDQAAAFARYHDLMSQPTASAVLAPARHQLVVVVIDLFLDWCKTNRGTRTYEWYQERCQSFTNSISPELGIHQLKPFHVQQWVDARTTWNDGMKRGAMIAIQRSFNWAMKVGHIEKSPIAYLEKPPAGKREGVVSPELYSKILRLVHDEAFRDLLGLAWETGSRPQELLALEARHVDHAGERLVFPRSEAKGKRRIRVVHLNAKALSIIQRLTARHADGKLLRNAHGLPWTRHAVNCRFCRLQKKIGIKVCLYTFRHSFCHNALKNGVDPITLANLMGHVDTAMIARVYSNLSVDQVYLKASLRRATGDLSVPEVAPSNA